MSEEERRCVEQQIAEWEAALEGRLELEEQRIAKEEWL